MSGFFRLKKFLSFYKPYKFIFTTVLFCAALSSLAALAFPLCIRYITTEVLAYGMDEAMPLIFNTLFVMLALVLVQSISGIFYDYKGHEVGARMERDMRNELFNHIQKLPVRFFDGEKTGSLMSRITNDLLNIAEFCHHGPENTFMFLASFIGSFIILFNINAGLTLVIFALLPLMIVYTVFFQSRLRCAYGQNREKIGELNADLEDTLSGIRVVKSFTNEDFEYKKFKNANENFLKGRVNIYKNESLYYSVMDFFFIPLISAAVVCAGAIFISRSVISAPDLIVFLLYIGYLTSPLSRIAQWVGLYQDALAGFGRFMEVMDMKAEKIAADISGGKTSSRFMGHVKFENVSFRYGEELDSVFENISLDIEAGTSIAFVGSSGAGKTTLLSLIPGFYEISSGDIFIDGINIKDIDLLNLRKNIGVVSQDVYLFNGTVGENIVYGRPDANKEEIIHAARMAKAHEFIMELPAGYETEIGQRGIRLSGGQRQRLSIARAFLKNPPILILDEATSSLDYENERAIHESIDLFMKDRTVLIIAHRQSTLDKADRVISLSEKNIEEGLV